MAHLNGNRGPDVTDRAKTSSANSTRPKGCRNKRRFPGRKQALTAMNGMKAAMPDDPGNDLLNIYRCPHGCHGWHVGHTQQAAA